MTGTQPSPESTPAPRSSDELREDLGELRAELGDTVEELAHRVDVPARVTAKRDEITERVRQQVAQARQVIVEKGPQVQSALRERPALLGAIALVLSYLLVSRLRKRRRTREDSDGKG